MMMDYDEFGAEARDGEEGAMYHPAPTPQPPINHHQPKNSRTAPSKQKPGSSYVTVRNSRGSGGHSRRREGSSSNGQGIRS